MIIRIVFKNRSILTIPGILGIVEAGPARLRLKDVDSKWELYKNVQTFTVETHRTVC